VVEATNESASVRFTYDEAGRLLEENTDGQIVKFVRNPVGAIVGFIDPDGQHLVFERDGDQRLTAVLDWSGGRYTFAYRANGALGSIDYPNRIRTTFEAAPGGFMTSLAVEHLGSRAGRESFTWEYDVCDRVTRMRTESEDRAYRYDREGR